MYFSINDQMVSDFFSGLIVVVALFVVGWLFSILLIGMARRYPISRLALIMVLSPLSFILFIEGSSRFALYLYVMIVMIIGIAIDGITYLRQAPAQPKAASKENSSQEVAPVEADPEVIIWEKAK